MELSSGHRPDIGRVLTWSRHRCNFSGRPWPVSRTSQCCSVTFSWGRNATETGGLQSDSTQILSLLTWSTWIGWKLLEVKTYYKKKHILIYIYIILYCKLPSFWSKSHGFHVPCWTHCPAVHSPRRSQWPGKSPSWNLSARAPNLWNSSSTGRVPAEP